MPETSSCMMALMPSSCACRRTNIGVERFMQNAITATISGNAHSTSLPNAGLSLYMQYMLPKVSIVVRIMPRTNSDRSVCTCVMSLVTRVTSEPVPKRSICGKEKVMIRRKQSLRMSLPTFCAAMCVNTLFSEPHNPPKSTRPIIRMPSVRMRCRSPTPPLAVPSTPSSTMRLMIVGWMRSMLTSLTMNAAASRANRTYFLTYFSMLSVPPHSPAGTARPRRR